MNDLTLEYLARRVAALEAAITAKPRAGAAAKDWTKAIGMFGGSEFMREVDEECRRSREAEREAARTRRQEF